MHRNRFARLYQPDPGEQLQQLIVSKYRVVLEHVETFHDKITQLYNWLNSAVTHEPHDQATIDVGLYQAQYGMYLAKIMAGANGVQLGLEQLGALISALHAIQGEWEGGTNDHP